jgi:hypothetical protein
VRDLLVVFSFVAVLSLSTTPKPTPPSGATCLNGYQFISAGIGGIRAQYDVNRDGWICEKANKYFTDDTLP